jgi:WD40 repeat protein
MLWLARALESAPLDSDGLRRTIRRNLAAWRPHLTPLRTILPHATPVAGVSFSPDGTILATADGKAIRTWDTSGFRPHRAPISHSLAASDPCSLVFDPTGHRLAMAGW